MTVGLSTVAIFSVFAGYFSETVEIRPTLLYSNTQSVIGFSVITKCMTLNDLDWLFPVEFCFHAALAGLDVQLSKNNCVKTNKDRHILSSVQIFSRKCSFWQYKICAHIRLDSLERH